MEILSNEAHSEVIAWLPHGQAFVIYQKQKFVNDVLPRYFKQTKYTSFTQKLNRWGFTRLARGPEPSAYYHNCFQRGIMRMYMQIMCQTEKLSGNNSMQETNSATPVSSRPSVYIPPPAYPQKAFQALILARKVHDNSIKLKQLATAASLQIACQSKQKPVLIENAAMDPNSEYSINVVKAAIDALQGPKSSGPSMTVTSQFKSLFNVSYDSGCSQSTESKLIHRAFAA